MKKIKFSDMDTYVYIDVSNIRWACLWSCGFNLDFIKLYNYIKFRYSRLREVRYYEGIELKDEKKRRHFEFLEKRIGYKVCSLERKGYVEPARYNNFKCARCGFENRVQVLAKTTKMKSNVDVYLATDMLARAVESRGPVHIVLISCDGDYAEAVKTLLEIIRQRIEQPTIAGGSS